MMNTTHFRHIDFAIIGAQKSGTTSLYAWLAEHPSVALPREKEVPFFVDHALYAAGTESLISRFYDTVQPAQLLGLAYVGMLIYPGVAELVFEHNPAITLFAVLRNPIDRAYSAYWHHRARGIETAPTFEAAIERELGLSHGKMPADLHLCYLFNGLYVDRLAPYLEFFPRSQLHIALYEELRDAPCRVLTTFLSALGLPVVHSARRANTPRNVSARPRSAVLHKLLTARASRVKSMYHALIPQALRVYARQAVTNRLILWNMEPWQYPPLSPATRRQLSAYFEPHNRRLASRLGIDIRNWTA